MDTPYLFLLDMKIPSNYHTLFVKSVATCGLNKKKITLILPVDLYRSTGS